MQNRFQRIGPKPKPLRSGVKRITQTRLHRLIYRLSVARAAVAVRAYRTPGSEGLYAPRAGRLMKPLSVSRCARRNH